MNVIKLKRLYLLIFKIRNKNKFELIVWEAENGSIVVSCDK